MIAGLVLSAVAAGRRGSELDFVFRCHAAGAGIVLIRTSRQPPSDSGRTGLGKPWCKGGDCSPGRRPRIPAVHSPARSRLSAASGDPWTRRSLQSRRLSVAHATLRRVGLRAGALVFTRARISLRRELGRDTAQDLTKTLETSVLLACRHANERRRFHVQGVGPVVQEASNVD